MPVLHQLACGGCGRQEAWETKIEVVLAYQTSDVGSQCGYQHLLGQQGGVSLLTYTFPFTWPPVLCLAVDVHLRTNSWAPCRFEILSLLQERPQCHCRSIERTMAQATISTASSIELSSVASTLGRRELGLGSADIAYDEERAQPSSRAVVKGQSNRIASCFIVETQELTATV